MGEIYSKAKTIDSWLIGGYALLRKEHESHIKENLTYGFMWQWSKSTIENPKRAQKPEIPATAKVPNKPRYYLTLQQYHSNFF